MINLENIRWTVMDLKANNIYLTQERWEHIINPMNHPEMSDYEEHLKKTIQKGIRKQDVLNPNKYRYTLKFKDLTDYNTHIVAIVLFRFVSDENSRPLPNNYIVTAYQKEIG
ncbi:hypothetical protein QUF70_09600 [Desulfobacterales bacterium HSG17]|nr:hypothetical protein [Desulfobacterales bacterium HSG17]